MWNENNYSERHGVLHPDYRHNKQQAQRGNNSEGMPCGSWSLRTERRIGSICPPQPTLPTILSAELHEPEALGSGIRRPVRRRSLVSPAPSTPSQGRNGEWDSLINRMAVFKKDAELEILQMDSSLNSVGTSDITSTPSQTSSFQMTPLSMNSSTHTGGRLENFLVDTEQHFDQQPPIPQRRRRRSSMVILNRRHSGGGGSLRRHSGHGRMERRGSNGQSIRGGSGHRRRASICAPRRSHSNRSSSSHSSTRRKKRGRGDTIAERLEIFARALEVAQSPIAESNNTTRFVAEGSNKAADSLPSVPFRPPNSAGRGLVRSTIEVGSEDLPNLEDSNASLDNSVDADRPPVFFRPPLTPSSRRRSWGGSDIPNPNLSDGGEDKNPAPCERLPSVESLGHISVTSENDGESSQEEESEDEAIHGAIHAPFLNEKSPVSSSSKSSQAASIQIEIKDNDPSLLAPSTAGHTQTNDPALADQCESPIYKQAHQKRIGFDAHELAKERQRTNDAKNEARRRAWEQSHTHDKAPISARIRASPSFRKGLKATKSSAQNFFHQVVAVDYDFSSFKPPIFPKTVEQRQLVLDAVERCVCFAEFRNGGKARASGALQALVDAFKPVVVPVETRLLEQDSKTGNDHFCIVESGCIGFSRDGESFDEVCSGDSFGEQALLYHSPSIATATVVPGSEVDACEGASLLRLGQKTLRGLLRMYVYKAETEKRQIIENVDFLQDLLAYSVNSDDLVQRLSSFVKRHDFFSGETFVAHEDSTLYIVGDGRMCVEGGNVALKKSLKAGHYFGERIILGTMTRDSSVGDASTAKLTGQSPTGCFFTISHDHIETTLGPKNLRKLQQSYILGLSFSEMDDLSASTTENLETHLDEDDSSLENSVNLNEAPNASSSPMTIDLQDMDEIKNHNVGVDALTNHSASESTAAGRRRRRKFASRKSVAMQIRDNVHDAVEDNVELEDLEKESLLGEGEFGEVWLVTADIYKTGNPESNRKFALKSQLKVDDTRGKDAAAAIRREIEVLYQVDHPQIVDLVYTYEDESSLHMLMGLVPGGEIWDRIHQEDSDGDWISGLSEDDARFYTWIIADTLGYMHSQGFVYRDLKPENIMIDKDGYPVIIDFGFAKYCPDKTFTFCGTPNYVAPEIIKNSGHNRGVDFWALGVTLYEMITGENPFYFDGMDQTSLFDAICQEPHYPLKDGLSAELLGLVDSLLEKNPTKRLGMLKGGVDDILEHAWFGGLDLARVRAKRWPAPWRPDHEGEEAPVDCEGGAFENLIPEKTVESEGRESMGMAGSIFSEASSCNGTMSGESFGECSIVEDETNVGFSSDKSTSDHISSVGNMSGLDNSNSSATKHSSKTSEDVFEKQHSQAMSVQSWMPSVNNFHEPRIIFAETKLDAYAHNPISAFGNEIRSDFTAEGTSVEKHVDDSDDDSENSASGSKPPTAKQKLLGMYSLMQKLDEMDQRGLPGASGQSIRAIPFLPPLVLPRQNESAESTSHSLSKGVFEIDTYSEKEDTLLAKKEANPNPKHAIRKERKKKEKKSSKRGVVEVDAGKKAKKATKKKKKSDAEKPKKKRSNSKPSNRASVSNEGGKGDRTELNKIKKDKKKEGGSDGSVGDPKASTKKKRSKKKTVPQEAGALALVKKKKPKKKKSEDSRKRNKAEKLNGTDKKSSKAAKSKSSKLTSVETKKGKKQKSISMR